MIKNPSAQDIVDLEYKEPLIIKLGTNNISPRWGKDGKKLFPDELIGTFVLVHRTGSHTLQPIKAFRGGWYYNFESHNIDEMHFKDSEPEMFL